MEILIRIDWISVTDKKPITPQPSAHPSLMDKNWQECAGKNGYNVGQKHVTGVREYRNYSRVDMGRHTVYSSKALDRIKQMINISGTDVLIHHINEGHTVARLDLAIDFIGYATPVGQFVDAYLNGEVTTKLRTASVVKSLTNGGETLYLGSLKKRKNLIRVYNKGAEQGVDIDWIRVELQIMGKKATSTGKEICKSENIKETIIGIIKNIVDFKTVAIWKELTSLTQDVQMSSIPKSQGDTEAWLMNQVIPALGRTVVLNIEFWIQFKLNLSERIGQKEWNKIEEYEEF